MLLLFCRSTTSKTQNICSGQHQTENESHPDVSLPRPPAVTVSRSHTVHSVTVSQCQNVTESQCHSIKVSRSHSVMESQSHSLTVSAAAGNAEILHGNFFMQMTRKI